MGMSASQGRLLSLTSRLSDLELNAQNISNNKMRLASKSEDATKAYALSLNQKKLVVAAGINSNTGAIIYKDATISTLASYNAISQTEKQRLIKDSNGRVIVSPDIDAKLKTAAGDKDNFLTSMGVSINTASPNYDDAKYKWYENIFNAATTSSMRSVVSDEDLKSSEYLYSQLKSGNLYLETWNPLGGDDGNGAFEDASWSSGDSGLQEQRDESDFEIIEAEYNATMAEIQTKDKRYDLDLKKLDTEHSAVKTEVDSVKKVIDDNISRSFKIFNG